MRVRYKLNKVTHVPVTRLHVVTKVINSYLVVIKLSWNIAVETIQRITSQMVMVKGVMWWGWRVWCIIMVRCVHVSGEGGEYDVCGGMQCISYATSACVRVVSSRGANLSMRS